MPDEKRDYAQQRRHTEHPFAFGSGCWWSLTFDTTMTIILQRISMIVALIVAVAFLCFLAFPFCFPSGLSIRRTGKIISHTQSELTCRFEADVYRGIYFSPDGPTWRRRYYETVLCCGKGTPVFDKDRAWRKFEVGVDADCIGTRYYDEGYVLIAEDELVARLAICKGYAGFKIRAYVNGKYGMKKDHVEPGDAPNPHSPSAQGAGGR